MKRSAKIIILSLVVLLLAAAFVFVSRQPSITEEEEIDLEPTLAVRNIEGEIISMTLENSEGTFSFAKGESGWFCSFRNGEAAYGNTVVSLASMLKTTLANELIEENAKSLSKYGLETPNAILRGVTDKGEEYFIKIGNSIVGSKYYFTVDDKNVYTVSVDEGGLFFVGMSAFVNLDVTSLSIDNMTALKVSNGELIVIEKRDAASQTAGGADALFTYGVTSPVTANASPTDVQGLFESVASIGAKRFIPSPDAEEAGINPDRYFEIITTSGSIKCYVGNLSKSGYYVQKDGESGVYIVDESKLGFMNMTAFDVVDKHISIHYISEVTSIEVKSAEGGYVVTLGENSTVNGKAIEEDAATEFFRSVISLSYDGTLAEGTENGAVEVTVTLNTASGAETIEFLNAGAINYEVRKNGVFGLTIQRKYVDKILNLAKEL